MLGIFKLDYVTLGTAKNKEIPDWVDFRIINGVI